MNNGEQFIQHRDYVKRSVVQHYLGGRDDPSSGVGLYKKMKGRAYPLYSAGYERVGHTLLASYERPQDSYCASSIPYGPWVEEDDGSVRWLTGAEAGVYMGMSIAEASLLPMEYSTANSTGPNACRVPKRGVYRALGNSIIINMAEKHINLGEIKRRLDKLMTAGPFDLDLMQRFAQYGSDVEKKEDEELASSSEEDQNLEATQSGGRGLLGRLTPWRK